MAARRAWLRERPLLIFRNGRRDSDVAIRSLSGNAGSRDGEGYSALRLDFDRRLLLQIRSCVVASDAGPLAYREHDDWLDWTALVGDFLADACTSKNSNGQHRTQVLRKGPDECENADPSGIHPGNPGLF